MMPFVFLLSFPFVSGLSESIFCLMLIVNDNDETLQMGELDLCRIRSRYQVQSFTQFQLFSVLILSLKESGEGFHQARTAASPFRGDYGP